MRWPPCSAPPRFSWPSRPSHRRRSGRRTLGRVKRRDQAPHQRRRYLPQRRQRAPPGHRRQYDLIRKGRRTNTYCCNNAATSSSSSVAAAAWCGCSGWPTAPRAGNRCWRTPTALRIPPPPCGDYLVRRVALRASRAAEGVLGPGAGTGRDGPDFNTLRVDGDGGLLGYLAKVADHRKPKGIRHNLVVIVVARLSGANSVYAAAQFAASMPQATPTTPPHAATWPGTAPACRPSPSSACNPANETKT